MTEDTKTNWFKTRSATAIFAVIAFIGGFVFLGNDFTGNVILSSKQPFNLISFVGLLLIFCSAILAVYAIQKK